MKTLEQVLKTQDRFVVVANDTAGNLYYMGSLTNSGAPLVFTMGVRPIDVADMLRESFHTERQAQHVFASMLTLPMSHELWARTRFFCNDSEPAKLDRSTVKVHKIVMGAESLNSIKPTNVQDADIQDALQRKATAYVYHLKRALEAPDLDLRMEIGTTNLVHTRFVTFILPSLKGDEFAESLRWHNEEATDIVVKKHLRNDYVTVHISDLNQIAHDGIYLTDND